MRSWLSIATGIAFYAKSWNTVCGTRLRDSKANNIKCTIPCWRRSINTGLNMMLSLTRTNLPWMDTEEILIRDSRNLRTPTVATILHSSACSISTGPNSMPNLMATSPLSTHTEMIYRAGSGSRLMLATLSTHRCCTCSTSTKPASTTALLNMSRASKDCSVCTGVSLIQPWTGTGPL